VTFSNNIVRNSPAGINIAERIGNEAPARTFTIVNNLFERISAPTLTGANGRMFQLIGRVNDVTVAHNTFVYAPNAVAKHSALMLDGGRPSRLVFNDNVTEGVVFTPGQAGRIGLDQQVMGWSMAGNVMSGMTSFFAGLHPAGNYFPSSAREVGFINLLSGLLGLGGSSSYLGRATDGRNPGVDYTTLTAKTGNVVQQ
jgi:hypothetical protein